MAEGERAPKRVALNMKATPALRARIEESAKAKGLSIAQEVERTIIEAYRLEDEKGGAHSAALLDRIAADLRAIEAFSHSSWDQDLNTWYVAKRLINDAMMDHRPASKGAEQLVQAQAAEKRRLELLGVLLAAESKTAESGKLSASTQAKVAELASELQRSREETAAALEDVLAEQDQSGDLYDRFTRNRALAAALKDWPKKVAKNGA